MLSGPRVTLRAIEREDLRRFWQFNNDLAVELAGGGDPPMPQAFARVEAEFERRWADGGRDGAVFAIQADGQVIGLCQLSNDNTTARTTELGIAIGDPRYWGQGYGREAVGLLLDYAFRHRNMQRVWLWCHAANERGIRAYRACGFVEEGRLRRHVWSDGQYDDAVYMGILRDEWEAIREQSD